jgi:hypothetical protein
MRKALVVGIDNYGFRPLQSCINDATTFASIMASNGDGSPNFDVRLVTNPKTTGELRAHVTALFKGKCEVALFYFSGHGGKFDTDTYLITPDFNGNEGHLGLSMMELLKIVSNSNAENKVIILDSCHSGNLGVDPFGGKDESILYDGLTILTASGGDESAVEVNGHGVFTNLLLAALKGGAADIQGQITPGSIYAYIDQALGAWSQRPVFKTNTSKFNSIRNVPPKIPLDVLRKIIDFFPTAEHEFQLDPSYESTNTRTVRHEVIKPYADEDHVVVFKALQKLQSVGLVVPVETQHMYFAAMESKSCKLTALGYHYWLLAKGKRL